MHYQTVEASPHFAELEEETLRRWQKLELFRKSIAQRPRKIEGKSNEFVFYDGPPFANGLPHYGHLATGFVKDLIPRYQTMRGRHVERRFGWDCHGLPAELEVEQKTKISGRNAIIEYGIGKFNAFCKESVLTYAHEWIWYVTRQGRWVDFDNDYKTMDLGFMESVLWAFKTLWEKGLIYETFRVVPYSYGAQTPLSNFETRLDNSYRERLDPAITVAFRSTNDEPGAKPTYFLTWTTTPWTLPSNLALCVHPDLDYAVLESQTEVRIMADAARSRYPIELRDFTCTAIVKGAAFVGRHYRPLYPYFANTPGAFVVLADEFVTADDGTGIVHIAPGFGEQDLDVARAAGLPVFVPVDDAGKFSSEVMDYAGINVFEANPLIIRDLKQRGEIIRHDHVHHNYPHCWRTDTPLIYRAVNSWYLAVSRFRNRMVELNKGIRWVPEQYRDGLFGNWLEGARDWNLSRNRFWGTPLPIWRSDDPKYPRTDVYGSLDELERDFGVRLNDLHRPKIDELVRPNPDDPTGRSMMRRVPEVLDCWFESGSMPFAQLHYPFENKGRFEENFPGDFIVEYVAQTRGWFYTLVVLSTALFDRAPFLNCVCHGVVLDENHQKLSKRLQNYPDAKNVFAKYGADALRYYFLASPLMAGGDLSMPKDGSDIGKAMRPVILRLWNAYSFFTLYANLDGIKAIYDLSSPMPLDRYIIAKTRMFVAALEQRLDGYDIPGAYGLLSPFIDILNNWYIRNRRGGFWAQELSQDKLAAFNTLYTILQLFCRAIAPLLPILSECIYVGLTGEESVHLTDWPDWSVLPDNSELVAGMDFAREVCAGVLRLRETHERRTRLPLNAAIVAHPNASDLRPFAELIGEAINVTEVILRQELTGFGAPEIKVNPKIGARIGAKFKDVLAAQRGGHWSLLRDGRANIAGLILEPQDFQLRLRVHEGLGDNMVAEPIDAWRGVVVLDISIDPNLQRRGWARDFVRHVQRARKEVGLNIADRITVTTFAAPVLIPALTEHAEYIASQILATDLRTRPLADNRQTPTKVFEIDDHPVEIFIQRDSAYMGASAAP
jgi:isoleucyl-tRNA synthetase